MIKELQKRGHPLVVEDSLGAAQAVGLDAQGQLIGAADPRGQGSAAGL